MLMTSVTLEDGNVSLSEEYSIPWELLLQFEEVFEVLTELPHVKRHDHGIPLEDEYQTVKLRPYRYPYIQKVRLRGWL